MNTAQKSTEYFDIFLTDAQIHAQKMVNTTPLVRAVEKTIKSGAPSGRAYGKIAKVDKKNYSFEFQIPLDDNTRKKMSEAKKQGKTIRIWTPKEGLNIYLGKDAVEKIQAMHKKKDNLFDKLLRR